MALLGSTVDPRLFVQDYSGFTRAADIQGQSIANLGRQIAGGIERYGEMKQERKKLEAGTKAAVTGIESAIKMGESLGIDVKSSLTPYLDKINDPNVSPIEAAAYAQQASNSIANVLSLGMKVNEMGVEKARYAETKATRIAELQAEANKPGPITDVNVPGGVMQMRTNQRTGVLEPIQIAGIPQGTGLVDIVKELEGFNPKAYSDYKQTSVGYGTKGTKGEVLTETQATDRLSTELSGHAKRIEEAARLKGVQFNQNQFNALTSFDFNTGKGADLIERFGDKPEELVSKMQEYTKAGGEELPGLVKRRGIEAALFMTPTESTIGFAPEKEKNGEIVTTEEAARRTASGLSVTSTPIGGGMVRITSQTGSPKPSPVIESPESKLQTQRLLKLDESLGALREAGTTASLDIEPLKEVTKLLDEGVKTGFGRETLMQAKKILGQDVSNEEQFQARVGAEAMKNIALTKGAISDREMDYFKTVLSPNMGKTTEGNKKIIEFRIKYANRANKIAKTISNLQKNKKDPYEIQEAVDNIISSESLLDSSVTEKTRETPVKKTETELLREELGK